MSRIARLAGKVGVLVLAFFVVAAPRFDGSDGATALYNGDGSLNGALLFSIAGFALVAIGITTYVLTGLKFRLIEVVMVAKNGQETAAEIDQAMLKANFSEAAARALVLQDVAKIVSDPLVDGWAWPIVTTPRAMVSRAGSIYERRMRQLDLQPMSRAELAGKASQRLPATLDDACLVGLIFTTCGRYPWESGSVASVRNLLERLASGHFNRSVLAAYVYYGPEPGQRLEMETALTKLDMVRTS